MSALTGEREKAIREWVAKDHGYELSHIELMIPDLLAALDECRRERDEEKRELDRVTMSYEAEAQADPFLRYRNKITQTFTYISGKSGSGDYAQVIADMATELLGDLEVE